MEFKFFLAELRIFSIGGLFLRSLCAFAANFSRPKVSKGHARSGRSQAIFSSIF